MRLFELLVLGGEDGVVTRGQLVHHLGTTRRQLFDLDADVVDSSHRLCKRHSRSPLFLSVGAR